MHPVQPYADNHVTTVLSTITYTLFMMFNLLEINIRVPLTSIICGCYILHIYLKFMEKIKAILSLLSLDFWIRVSNAFVYNH